MYKAPTTMALAVVLMMGAAGCATNGKKDASIGHVDLTPGDRPSGYVEFVVLTKRNDSGVWIYDLRERQKPKLIGITGVRSGGKFEAAPQDINVPICETLRVAVEPGLHHFGLESNGPKLSAVVFEGMVTRVEVDREFIDKAVNYDVYRMTARVLLPVNSLAGMTAEVEQAR